MSSGDSATSYPAWFRA